MSVEYWSTAVQLYKAFLSIRSFQGNEVFASIRTFFCTTKLVWYSEKYFSPGFFSFFLVISASTCHRFQIISVTRLSVKCSRNKPIVRWNLKWIWLNHTTTISLIKKTQTTSEIECNCLVKLCTKNCIVILKEEMFRNASAASRFFRAIFLSSFRQDEAMGQQCLSNLASSVASITFSSRRKEELLRKP